MSRIHLPDLCQETVQRYLKLNVLDEKLKKMEGEFQSLLNKCPNPEDQQLLKSCFATVKYKGVDLNLPKPRVQLKVHHVLRLLELGFRLGKMEEGFEVRTSKSGRIPFYQNQPLDEKEWNRSFECVLKHEICQEITQIGKECTEEIQKIYGDENQGLVKNKQVSNILVEEMEKVMFRKRPPTKTQLQNPPMPKSSDRLHLKDFESSLGFHYSQKALQAAKMQNAKQLPSLFDGASLHEIRSIPQAFVFLLDLSASTSEQDIYRFASASCSSIQKWVKKKIPDASLWILPYNETPLTPLLEITDFPSPSGTTSTDLAFQAAQMLLKPCKGSKTVIHITDGLPNDLARTIEQAKKFSSQKIQFNQIVFGHTERLEDIAEYFLLQANQEKSLPSRYEKYLSNFTSVTAAAQGNQVLVWMLEELSGAISSMTDLSVAVHFLENHPKYQKLLQAIQSEIT